MRQHLHHGTRSKLSIAINNPRRTSGPGQANGWFWVVVEMVVVVAAAMVDDSLDREVFD